MRELDPQYHYLISADAPRMIVEFLKLLGTDEIKGAKHNPVILSWAKELGLNHVYKNDETAWCGLAMAIVAHRAGKPVVHNPLWAKNWAKFGTAVTGKEAMIGDVLVFNRAGGGGHVGLYVAEDNKCYHTLGGNQSNTVNITRIEKWRLHAARRSNWKTGPPAGMKKMYLSAAGAVSQNEA